MTPHEPLFWGAIIQGASPDCKAFVESGELVADIRHFESLKMSPINLKQKKSFNI